ncbi:MAG: hypothetical protein K8S14_07915, partial [Actinomycetia bacterium]|nr:hypothetical protein [Actinomycetes bacterium]
MALIRVATERVTRYVQVADYYYDQTGKRKLKILKSFGKETPESRTEAEVFLSNLKTFEKIKKSSSGLEWDEFLKKVGKIGGGL